MKVCSSRSFLFSRAPAALSLACAVALGCVAASLPAPGALAANTAQAGRASDWELDFRPGPLRLILDPEDARAYWYFTYRVVNRSGRERMWAPRFELFTDSGEIQRSGRDVPSRVTEAVHELLGNPLLVDQNQIIGELLVGEEHAKEGVVIFPADPITTDLTVFVTGASGKVRKMAHPVTSKPITQRWTIRFNYTTPGNPLARGSRPVDPAPTDEDVAAGAQRRMDWGVWLWR